MVKLLRGYVLLLALHFVPVSYSNAQRQCGHTEYLNFLRSEGIDVDSRMAENEKAISNWIQNNNGKKGSRGVVTIPVVVHVIYQTSEQNISDAQVQSQIDVLNEDFRRLNADRTNTPSIFQSVAADVEIEFCLARQDPDGNPTNGITRTQTNATVFQQNNNMKQPATGGKSSWNTSKYLNIWVCNLADGVLGYGTLPNTTASSFDGVVISYKHFGRGGSAQSPYNMGRTTTHEVGHWLNLIHIWGDDEGTSDPCNGSDQVSDTPNQATPNQGCPTFPKSSCGNTSDMFMNYMDYTRDNCMNLFTQGQKTRMQAALNNLRPGILSSKGCLEPVFEPQCDTLNNILGADGLVLYSLSEVDTGTGYLTGRNSAYDKCFAEAFETLGEFRLNALRLDFGKGVPASSNDSIDICIWNYSELTEGPGDIIASERISVQDLNTNIGLFRPTIIEFSNPPKVEGLFFAGFSLRDSSADTVAIYTNQWDESNFNTAWVQRVNGEWHPFTVAHDIAISLAIQPFLCSTVGIESRFQLPDVEVYPNPVSEILYLNLPRQSNWNWEFFSLGGKLYKSGSMKGESNSISVRDLPSGVYLLRIRDGESIANKRVLIAR